MTKVFSLLGFVAHLAVIEKEMNEVVPAIVAKACQLICDEAKRVIGHGYDDWPALKPETLARKMMNSPLLETGELRASISWMSEGNRGVVGSNNEKAVWHEFGTSRIPPRSFLLGAAQHKEDEIHKMAARAVVAVMAGRGLLSPEVRELLHLLKHVAHEMKETSEDIMDQDENNERKRR
jgi:phage gpG-like protein